MKTIQNKIINPLLIFVLAMILAICCKKNEESSDSVQNFTVTDKDGNSYKTVTIGTQTWLAENLKTTKYNDGTIIPFVTDNIVWANLTTPGYCWYNNDAATNKSTYGALYNWYSVKTGKLCPTGWHMPSDGEWTILTTFLGGEKIAGDKLKEIGTTHWTSPNVGATNDVGFTALPGGFRNGYGALIDGGFYYRCDISYCWTSTEVPTTYAWGRLMYNSSGNVGKEYFKMQFGLSVRCLHD